MKITIIGAGNMARGIASRFVAGGHEISLVDRDWQKANALATDLGKASNGATVTVASLEHALANPVVVLAVAFASAREFAAANAVKLAGKIVVDVSNPLNATFDGLVTAPGKSAAEEIANLLPKSRLVKAFNTNFATTLVAGRVNGQALDVFVAGDDKAAKDTVIGLVNDGGLRGLDAGPLTRARELESLGLLGITLQGPLGLGFQSAWKLVA